MQFRFPRLNLTTRLLCLTALAGSFTVISPIAIQIWANARVQESSEKIGRDRLQRSRGTMSLYAAQLESAAIDEATWTEMRDFTITRDPEWARANLTDWVPDALDLDLVLVLSKEGELIYELEAADSGTSSLARTEVQFWQDVYFNLPLFPATSTFWQRPEGIYMVAFAKISTSDDHEGKLPPHGLYMVGKLIDSEMLAEMKSLTLEDYILRDAGGTAIAGTLPEELDDRHLPELFENSAELLDSMPDSGTILEHRTGTGLLAGDRLDGILPLRDPFDRPLGMLEVEYTLPSWYLVPIQLNLAWISLFGTGGLLFVASSYLLVRWVLAPVSQVQRAVVQFSDSPEPTWDCNLPPGDAIGSLAMAFATLVEQLQVQAKQAWGFGNIASWANQSTEFRHTWPKVGQTICTMLAANDVIILKHDAEGELEILYTTLSPLQDTWNADYLSERLAYLPKLRDGESVALTDIDRDTSLSDTSRTFHRSLGIGAIAAFPLWEEDRVCGSLIVCASAPKNWNAAELRLLDNVVEQLAVALEKQQLFRETQQQAKQLREYNRSLEDLISALGHDLRNPLFSQKIALTALVERLEHRSEATDDKPAQLLNSARNSLQINLSLSNLVENLLNISRYQAGQKQLVYAPLNWEQTIADAYQLLEQSLLAKSLQWSVSIAPNLPAIEADVVEIGRIIQNMLSNAIRFTPSGGQISVCVDVNFDGIFFSCRDTGKGISAEAQKNLFQRFYQAGRSSEKGGTGMGLYLCRKIIEAHKGRIGVESQVGQGSTFWFTLPISTHYQCCTDCELQLNASPS
ncbi:ATP-binding protein [Synechococcus sp. PCC 7336]|uniref:ATP-binding protein n=1 Tax=Synechococcus sp. PCC 7336 TaxID=195250 RepID=UPI0003477253|nr:ATP-binding protein [Synechococcus sp. PCC 7336]